MHSFNTSRKLNLKTLLILMYPLCSISHASITKNTIIQPVKHKELTKIQLKELKPVIDLNNIEEKNFYFKQAMRPKQRFIYCLANVVLYVFMGISIQWSELVKFETKEEYLFLSLLFLHLLATLSVFFCYYQTYRNIFLYGANGLMLTLLLTAYIGSIPLTFQSFFYITSILFSVIMSVMLAMYNKKVYSISMRDIIEELQSEKTGNSNNTNIVILI